MSAGRRRAAWAAAALIARRYLLARSHGYATLINWVSFVGLALGVMILTVVVSVMNGFDREITGRLLRAVPHAVVERPDADIERLAALPGVARASRFFRGEAMLAEGGTVHFLSLAGFDDDGLRHAAADLGAAVGALRGMAGGIVLGAPLALAKGLAVGDPVTLVAPTGGAARPAVARFTLAGTFAVGAEPDARLAIVRRADIAARGLAGAGVDGVRLHFADPLAVPAFAGEVRRALGELSADGENGDAPTVRFWMDDYGELFRAVKIEKAIMFALLALIVAIAAFNIVSGQAMLVNDKRGDVAMLATLGASRRFVVLVFFLQGFAVAVAGIVGGLAAGVLLAVNADAAMEVLAALVGASLLDGTVFAEVPSQVLISDLAAILGLSLGLSLLAALLPARKAAAENPADALHRT